MLDVILIGDVFDGDLVRVVTGMLLSKEGRGRHGARHGCSIGSGLKDLTAHTD